MLLTSPSFNHNEKIPPKFTCDGGNINPELHIQNVPPEAKSLVLIMDDPDAPGGNFTHWLTWNINPMTQIIKQESKPPFAAEGLNGRQKIGYTGPCPPDDKPHRYFFKLYALKEKIDPDPNISKSDLENAIKLLIVEKAEFIGTYERIQ
ncbi:MAG: YbhB/YbcL family Raf kinase inhibitor-like protein [Patescibacteria group bacterium]